MRFYHYTFEKLNVLEPMVGPSRHGGEDPGAVGLPVVWLSNETMARLVEGKRPTYLHVVEIDPEDPALHLDQLFDQAMKAMEAFGTKSTMRWYYYAGRLIPIEIHLWNGMEYVQVDSGK